MAALRAKIPDLVVEVLLIALLCYLPFAFGGVLPASHVILISVAAAMAACLAVRCVISSVRFVWSLSYVPIAGFLALVALQIVPLPRGVVELLAPGNARVWSELLADPPAAAAASERLTISLYPHATWADLRLLLAAATIFVVLVNVYRRRAQVERLLGAIVIIGGLVGLVGLLQVVTDARAILWVYETPGGGTQTGGPFVHRGHFAQFLNLSIGAALALLLVRLARRKRGDALALEDLFTDLSRPGRRIDALLIAFIIGAMITVALSLSRNGVISLLVGGAVAATALHLTRYLSGVGWPMVGMFLIALLLLVFIGIDPVVERFETLENPDEAYGPRLALLRDTWSMTAAFPFLGAGLGSYEAVFPKFDSALRGGTAAHAENQYAEMLGEVGALGALLVLATIAFVVHHWLQASRRATRAHRPIYGAVFGVIVGLIAVAFNAFTDFGLRVPAIAIATTALVALIVRLGSPEPSRAEAARNSRRSQLVGAATMLVLTAMLASTLPAGWRAVKAEKHWRFVDQHEGAYLEARSAVRAEGEESKATPQALDETLAHARAAAALEPSNVKYRFWSAIVAWRREVAHARAALPEGERDKALTPTPKLVAAAQRARDAALAARTVCPTYGLLWSFAGQLAVQWLNDPAGKAWIHRGRDLAPHNAAACLASARQAVLDGEDDRAVETFRRAIVMGAHGNQVLGAILGELKRPDLAERVAQGSYPWLAYVAQRLREDPSQAERVARLEAEAVELARAVCETENPPDWAFYQVAMFLEKQGNDDESLSYFERFLQRRPAHGARLNYARVLSRLGRTEEAKTQCERLLAVHPNHGGAKALLLELHDPRRTPPPKEPEPPGKDAKERGK